MKWLPGLLCARAVNQLNRLNRGHPPFFPLRDSESRTPTLRRKPRRTAELYSELWTSIFFPESESPESRTPTFCSRVLRTRFLCIIALWGSWQVQSAEVPTVPVTHAKQVLTQQALTKQVLTKQDLAQQQYQQLAAQPAAVPGNKLLTTTPTAADFALVGQQGPAQLRLDAADFPGVRRAAATLQNDIAAVTGQRLTEGGSGQQPTLIIGTVGKSALIDQLVQAGKLDVSAIQGRWEAYQISVLQQPLPDIPQALVIAGSDKRGTIFGIYELAEQIGVSPWVWWADVPVKTSPTLYIKAGPARVDAPKVKYRGIFLNDEYPALTRWVDAKYGGYNAQFYLRVFELLQRLKANFLWPAMWNNAFADDDPQNAVLADEMGIVMSTSHHEPMMRADKEWNRYGKGPWEYSKNRAQIYQFWQQGAKRHQQLESMFTLGMRGQEDEPMSEGENIGLLEQIVADQRQILAETFQGRDIKTVPQVWALYKEVQGFYEKGMRVPDDVTLLWADDNFGNLRRLPTAQERGRSGGAGVYYHFDYVGGPRSYTWINSTPVAKIWQQMALAWRYQADRIWIVNVGDLKPMEYPIDFFLRMAWDPTRFDAQNLAQYARDFATQQFGPAYAQEIAALLEGYSRHNGRRKPEAMTPDSYSLLAYDEAGRVSRELADLAQRSSAVLEKLPPNQHDAFIQLVDHPVQASQALFELYHAAAKNQLAATQGRPQTNSYADEVRRWFARDGALTDRYHALGAAVAPKRGSSGAASVKTTHEEQANAGAAGSGVTSADTTSPDLKNRHDASAATTVQGRWAYMMSQPHIGLTYWRNPEANVLPLLYNNSPIVPGDMGVAPQGSTAHWPVSDDQGEVLQLPRFDRLGTPSRSIDIFNKGTEPFDFKVQTSADWLQVSSQGGTVRDQHALQVSIDWTKTRPGLNQGEVRVRGTGWGWAKVQVSALNHQVDASAATGAFADADGYISVNASSAQVQGNTASRYWQPVPGLGRFLLAEQASAMVAVTPPDAEANLSTLKQAPRLTFPLYFQQAGTFELQAMLSPTLNFVPGRGLRLAIALDDNEPVLLDTLADLSERAWAQSVLDNIRVLKHPLQVNRPGRHQLQIYLVDPALALQKLVIDTGALQPSYLGPPQSLRLP